MFADLHIHTTYSDGVNTPREILKLANKQGIDTVAITDHNCIGGVRQALGIASEYDINVITGIELLSFFQDDSAHILGYHIDINSAYLAKFLKESARLITENTRINFENTKKIHGLNYSWDKVLKRMRGQEMITGFLLIHAMEKDKYKIPNFNNNWDYFNKYFSIYSKDHIFTETKTPFEAIDVIKKAKGIPIVAHPKQIGSNVNMYKLIEHGAMGLEVYHPMHSKADSAKYLGFCKNNDLYVTGGSGWIGKDALHYDTAIGKYGLENSDYDILKVKK